MGSTLDAAVSVAFREGVRGKLTPPNPPILIQPSSHLLGDIGLSGLSLHRVFPDLKNIDSIWLDSLLPPVRLSSIQAIPCAP